MNRTIQPLYFDCDGTEGIWGSWQLPCEDPYTDFLTERERLEYAALKSERRKKEWLGARVALKTILKGIDFIESPLHCETEKDRVGCPRVKVQRGETSRFLNCSISHKNGLVVVCVSLSNETKLGIDVETVTERAWRVRKAFVNSRKIHRSMVL